MKKTRKKRPNGVKSIPKTVAAKKRKSSTKDMIVKKARVVKPVSRKTTEEGKDKTPVKKKRASSRKGPATVTPGVKRPGKVMPGNARPGNISKQPGGFTPLDLGELRPGILDDFGISAAMEWQSKEFRERTGIRCDFLSEPENIVLDPDRSVAIFRIFQETLTNIVRHANATVVDVSLEETPGEVRLVVHDNGIGISESQLLDSRSFGLIGMNERVNDLGGS